MLRAPQVWQLPSLNSFLLLSNLNLPEFSSALSVSFFGSLLWQQTQSLVHPIMWSLDHLIYSCTTNYTKLYFANSQISFTSPSWSSEPQLPASNLSTGHLSRYCICPISTYPHLNLCKATTSTFCPKDSSCSCIHLAGIHSGQRSRLQTLPS